MKKLIVFAMVAMSLTIFNGCQKEELKSQLNGEVQPQEAVKPDVYVENGYLAFKNMGAVDSIIFMLNKMTTTEKEAWEEQMRFKSARAEFDALFEEYDKLESYEAFLQFKEKNKEKLKFNEMDREDCSIDYPYATFYFLPVLNNNGVYKIGNSLIKYTKEEHIVIADGDINKLNNLNEFYEDENVIIMPRLKSFYNTFSDIHFFPEDHPEGWNDVWHEWAHIDNRRINHKLFAEQYRYDYFDYNTNTTKWVNGIKIYLNQRGQKYSWFKWRDYNTTYGITEIKCQVGTAPVWEDIRIHISEEVKPSINFQLYHYWYETSSMPSLIPVPTVNFAAKVTFRGFGFNYSDYYPIDIPTGYGTGNNNNYPGSDWGW